MLTRRGLLVAAVLTALIPREALSAPVSDVPLVISLWPGEPPGGGGPQGPDMDPMRGAVRNVVRPNVRLFLPEKPNGGAMLVVPGGGYRQISVRGEGYSAAKWLNDRGYAAFVLTYRLPAEGWTAGPMAPLQDGQRAMRVIRSMAARFGYQRDRVGILGFSAGGHLAAMVSVRSTFASYQPVDDIDHQPDLPNWTALAYPVITFEPPYNRLSSLKHMLGAHPSDEAMVEWSAQTYVDHRTPPVFLVQANDDPIVNIAHSEIMQAVCQAAQVPVEFDHLKTGGHGFALGRRGTDSEVWTTRFAGWLKKVDGTALVAKR
jgi:acetyl esterase/lipase